ncbi:hypothetical protein JCM19237_314 [Photobacterium aphoticum]|uniref:Uncharacterized protein n=1 Tax=Photobacterium aphoticum TaxID=754436 RepID=A0A090R1E8_9GAMM|nr:hypothetical protein JCM19237_314 [Photobacterium aphoticum]
MGIVLVYQAVVRDWLAIVYGVEHLPKAAIDVQTMAMTLIKLFAGAL